MPQIAQLAETYASQIFWLVVFFGFTFFVIGRHMVPKVMATVEARERQIVNDLSAAEAARKASDAAEKTWNAENARQRSEAHALIAKAKLDAAKATETRLHAASQVIDARIAEADARISAAKYSALQEIEAVASEAASDIVARVAGINVDAGTARSAVKEVLHG